MKIFLLLFCACFTSITLFSQELLNKKVMDEKSGKDMLIGYSDRSGLESSEFGSFFAEEYKNYLPDMATVQSLSTRLKTCTVTIILATWCQDSKEQVGRFFNILDKAGYKNDSITLICVDRLKLAGSLNIEKYSIEKVPTFILYKDNIEIGRITETPVISLEKDLLELTRKIIP